MLRTLVPALAASLLLHGGLLWLGWSGSTPAPRQSAGEEAIDLEILEPAGVGRGEEGDGLQASSLAGGAGAAPSSGGEDAAPGSLGGGALPKRAPRESGDESPPDGASGVTAGAGIASELHREEEPALPDEAIGRGRAALSVTETGAVGDSVSRAGDGVENGAGNGTEDSVENGVEKGAENAAGNGMGNGTGSGIGSSTGSGTGSGTGRESTGPGGMGNGGPGLGAGAGSGSGGPGSAAYTRLLAHLRAHAARCYPRSAERRSLEGSVKLSFCIDAGGIPNRIELEASSGSALLDSAAIDCVVKGGAPLPAPAGCLSVPIRFSLR